MRGAARQRSGADNLAFTTALAQPLDPFAGFLTPCSLGTGSGHPTRSGSAHSSPVRPLIRLTTTSRHDDINRTLYLLKLVLLPTGLAVAGAMAAITAPGGAPVAEAPPAVEVNSSNVTPVAFRELADRVLSDFDPNEALSDSAPRQQVVAAWATKDFGYLLVSQGDETNDGLRTLNHNVAALLDVQPALVQAAPQPPSPPSMSLQHPRVLNQHGGQHHPPGLPVVAVPSRVELSGLAT